MGVLVLAVYLLFAAAGHAWAVQGNIDGDGDVDFGDLRLMMQAVAGIVEPSAEAVARADMDSNGALEMKDVTELNRQLWQAPQGSHLLPHRDSISFTDDRVWDVQLPGGFLVTGTVVDSHGNSITDTRSGFPIAFGSINFMTPGGTARATVVDETGDYRAVLAPGSHDVTTTTLVQYLDAGTGILRQRYATVIAVPPAYLADGDAVRDFIRPDLPGTSALSGAITAPDVQVSNADILSDDASDSAYVTVPSGGTTYNLIAFPMEGRVGLFGAYTGFPSGGSPSVGVRFGAVTVLSEGESETLDLTTRLLEHVEGTIHVTGGENAASISASTVVPSGGTADE